MLRKGLVKMAMEFHSWNAGPALRGHRHGSLHQGPGDTAASVHGARQHRLPLLSPTVCAPGRPATSSRVLEQVQQMLS